MFDPTEFGPFRLPWLAKRASGAASQRERSRPQHEGPAASGQAEPPFSESESPFLEQEGQFEYDSALPRRTAPQLVSSPCPSATSQGTYLCFEHDLRVPAALDRGRRFVIQQAVIFVPKGFHPRNGDVDVLLYLHGYKAPCAGKAQDTILQLLESSYFRSLPDAVAQSGRNVVFVAPTLGIKGEAGPNGGFARDEPWKLLESARARLAEHFKPASGQLQIRKIILAGHSGAGSKMRALIERGDREVSKIKAFWGIDCTYPGCGQCPDGNCYKCADEVRRRKFDAAADGWYRFARDRRALAVTLVRANRGTAAEVCQLIEVRAKRSPLSNLTFLASSVNHCASPAKVLPELLRTAALEDIAGPVSRRSAPTFPAARFMAEAEYGSSSLDDEADENLADEQSPFADESPFSGESLEDEELEADAAEPVDEELDAAHERDDDERSSEGVDLAPDGEGREWDDAGARADTESDFTEAPAREDWTTEGGDEQRRNGASPTRLPATDVDEDAAEPLFSAKQRALMQELLPEKALEKALAENRQRHPAKSDIPLAVLQLRLERYLDRAALTRAIAAARAAGRTVAGDNETLTALLTHQFQSKCFRESRFHTGKLDEPTLDALGFVRHRGKDLNKADRGHGVAKKIIARAWKPALTAHLGNDVTAATWFDFMLDAPFLGLSTRWGSGVHLELMRRLRTAQRYLMSLPAYADLTPSQLGDRLLWDARDAAWSAPKDPDHTLGDRHRGNRPYAKKGQGEGSMHGGGLAIDLAYRANPWLRASDFATLSGQIARLVAGRDEELSQKALSKLGESGKSTTDIYGYLAQRNDWLRQYFSVDDTGLKALIEARRTDGTKRVLNRGESVAAAVKRWRATLRADEVALQKGSFSAAGIPRAPRRGFLSLGRDLVVALRDHACLAWGGVDLGSSSQGSGDMMHFDCRVQGIGRAYAKAVSEVLGKGPNVPKVHPCVQPASGGQRELDSGLELEEAEPDELELDEPELEFDEATSEAELEEGEGAGASEREPREHHRRAPDVAANERRK